MASYCQEKFERSDTGEEKIVYWKQNKHVHNAAFISDIQTALARKYDGTWNVRANSYMSNVSNPSPQAVDYAEL